MVPLPAEINPNGEVIVSLNEIGSGRNVFAADISLGELSLSTPVLFAHVEGLNILFGTGTVFYHNFGTICASPQLKLERGPYATLIHSVSVSETHLVPLMFLMLIVVVAVVFSALWSLLCTCSAGPTQKPSLRTSSPQKNSPPRNDSVSTLTETDNETADVHSLAPRRRENVQRGVSSSAAMRVGTNTRKTRRVRKAVFNPYDDTVMPDDGHWDPWFSPSGW